jgi:hypothetical protein
MPDASRAEINRLYWGTDRSVGDIADALGVSRRSLYDSIEPRPAGAPCPDCGGALGFRNRTAAERREAECPDCGLSTELGARTAPDAYEEPEVEQEREAGRISPLAPRRVPASRSGPLLGSTLLAGLAVGAAAGYLIRRG